MRHLHFQAIPELVSSAITNRQPVIYGFGIIEFLGCHILWVRNITYVSRKKWFKEEKIEETPSSETVFGNCVLTKWYLRCSPWLSETCLLNNLWIIFESRFEHKVSKHATLELK